MCVVHTYVLIGHLVGRRLSTRSSSISHSEDEHAKLEVLTNFEIYMNI